LAHFLDRTQANPSLVVFCGGSAVLQQRRMRSLVALMPRFDVYLNIGRNRPAAPSVVAEQTGRRNLLTPAPPLLTRARPRR
jgi:hypothetical protein